MTGPHHPHSSDDILAKAEWIKRLSLSLVRDREKAEDLAQETLLRALQYRSEPKRNLSAWIRRVAKNLAIAQKVEELRRRKRDRLVARPEAESDPQEKQLTPEINIKEAVAAELQALREPFRTAVLLHFFYGLSAQEMAARLGISQDNAYKRIQRGLALLGKQLDKRYRGREFWMVAIFNLFKSVPKWKVAAAFVAVPAASLLFLPAILSPGLPLEPPLELAKAEKPAAESPKPLSLSTTATPEPVVLPPEPPLEVSRPIESKPVVEMIPTPNLPPRPVAKTPPPPASLKPSPQPPPQLTAPAPAPAPALKTETTSPFVSTTPPKKARSLGPNKDGVIKGTLIDTEGNPLARTEMILMREPFSRHMMEKGLLFLSEFDFGPPSLNGPSFLDLGVPDKDYAILKTDSSGGFECSGPGIGASVLLFKESKNSPWAAVGGARAEFALPNGSTQIREFFVLAPSRRIEVKVLDPNGKPVKGARVTVSFSVPNLGKIDGKINLLREYPSPVPLSGLTEESGTITLERIPNLASATIAVEMGNQSREITLAELEKAGFKIQLPY